MENTMSPVNIMRSSYKIQNGNESFNSHFEEVNCAFHV